VLGWDQPQQLLQLPFDETRRADDRRREEERQDTERKRDEVRQREIESIRDAERKRDEKRAEDERKRDEQARKDAEVAYQRRVEDETKRHERDMERMRLDAETRAKWEKEQRETLLALEQKKLELIQREANSREELTRKELERTRLDFERTSKDLTAQMSGVQDSVTAQVDKDREQLKREFDLRQKAMDNEHSLRTEMLKLREEMNQKGESDGFTRMLEKIVGEVGKNVKEVIEWKKLETTTNLSPEAQAAAMTSKDANITSPPERVAGAAPTASRPASQGAPSATQGNGSATGNGHSEAGEAPKGGRDQQMEKMVKEMVQEPFLQEVLQEWGRHVAQGRPATMFANLFMEWMRDPSDDRGRKACAAFATVVDARTHAEMLPLLAPGLTQDLLAVFRSPAGEEFYESFRTMVGESIRDYWEQFLAQREAKKAQASAGEEAPTQS